MDSWPVRFVLFLNQKFAPLEGWLSLAALTASILIVVQVVEEAAWVRNAPSMYAPTLAALVLGIIVAKWTRHAFWVVMMALLGGLVVSILTAARAWPSLLLIRGNLRHFLTLLRSPEASAAEVVMVPDWMLDRLQTYLRTLALWGESITGANPLSIAPFFTLVLLVVLWGVTFWAAWATFRYHRALVALVPAGIFMATNVFFAETGLMWLPFFMAGMVVLGVRLQGFSLTYGWEDKGIDYSPEFRLEFYMMGFMIAAAVAAIMILVPNVRIGAVTRAFWDLFREPYQAVEAQAERVIPELNRAPRSLSLGRLIEAGGLPRSHLLGASPELEQTLVMYVSTSDGMASPEVHGNYRWRAITFSDYNGRGWENTESLVVERFDPGETWLLDPGASRRSVRQTFDFVGERPFWLYALGEPIAADHPYRAHLRQPGDAVGLDLRAKDYTVISQMPDASEVELRAAPTVDTVALSTYLALPDSVSDRVSDLAKEVTGAAETPYDKARALEAFLRTYPYNLEIPEPPEDIVDITDYFLFDLQQGYCDYYATSMVVMARSLGLPARLAIGYAAGAYDMRRDRFAVTEADAHSWPEIYFQDYGWIPFEPTATQPQYVRKEVTALELAQTAEPMLDLRSELAMLRRNAWLSSGTWRLALALVGMILLILLARYLRREWTLRRQASNAWQLAYLRLEAWGDTIGVRPAVWYTPTEYVLHWRAWLSRRYQQQLSAMQAAESIYNLGQALEKRAYARVSERPSDAQARALWRQLRAELWRLRISGWFRRTDDKNRRAIETEESEGD